MPLLNVVIDIAHHESLTDNGFHQIKDAGIVAVFHKATQGMASVDPEYDERRTRALSVGLLWGSYHFGVRGNGAAQADHYLSIIHPRQGEMMTLDFEPNHESDTMRLDDATAFVQRIQEQTGRLPMLYSGQAFLKEQAARMQPRHNILLQCPLWIARYSNGALPVVPSKFTHSFRLWQYTDGAVGLQPHSVPGVGRCDRNKWNGTLEELQTFWANT